MDGKRLKSVIIVVLFLGVVLEQNGAEARIRCRSTTGRKIYTTCRLSGKDRSYCARISGCEIVDGNITFPIFCLMMHSFADKAAAQDFCKLGCAASLCGNVITGVGNDEEVTDDAVERCNKACDRFCTKDIEAATGISF
ncbi:hypothetical protein PR202_gb11763 [Eleusine coracana subsp. coracana]|uniref:Acidic protein n=1 Tax=Eleusine coracana subsp. coracana TaxID=191504 RepID=A0AAV5ENS2_ELECO|nr:hypothetical protein PR202_gb11763 [Eleusine coracana subsp. coracana]